MELHEPFYLARSLSTPEDTLNAVVGLHEAGGVNNVTISAIAAYLGMAKSSIHAANRGLFGLYETLAESFVYRWSAWVREAFADPVPIRLPDDDCGRLGVATLQSLRAIAGAEERAGRPDAARSLARTLDRERDVLIDAYQYRTGERPDARWLEMLLALADGIRLRMLDSRRPLDLEEARAILAAVWSPACDGDRVPAERSSEDLEAGPRAPDERSSDWRARQER
ncbi:hypothetical protein [Nocardioides montaniterrae]